MLRFKAGLLAAFLAATLNSDLLADETSTALAKPVPVDGDWEARIERALASDFSFKGIDLPLKDFADQVSEKAGITVLVDRRALDDVGIDDDVPVTRDLAGISLRSVLRLVLKELDLAYDLRDGALVITTPEYAYSQLHTRWYDVTDLADDEPPAGSDRFDCDQIVDVITSTISPMTWERVGGYGAIAAVRGRLVVSQTRDVHKAIDEILPMFRKAKQLSRTHGTQPPPVTYIDAYEEDSAEQRIRRVLQQSISIDFQEEPFEDVVAKLREQSRINIEIDTCALNDVGIGTDLPITFRANNMRLEFVLRYILCELDLTYVIRDEVLLITTPEEGERCLVTRLYPVGDLLGPIHGRDLFGDPIRPTTIVELIDMITTIVAPNNWDHIGGQGSIARFATEDFLVVTHTDDAHDELVQTLTRLRANLAGTAKNPGPEAESTATVEPTRLVVYFVQVSSHEQTGSLAAGTEQATLDGGARAASSQRETEELMKLVADLIKSTDDAARDDVFVRAIPGRLVIRHTDHVHKQVEKLLEKLRVRKEDAPQVPWTGGTGQGGMF